MRSVSILCNIVTRIAVTFAFVFSIAHAEEKCAVQTESLIVAGESMLELFKPGTSLQVQKGWYACHVAERGDVAIIQMAYRPRPIVKLIQVLPGDRFHLIALGEGYQLTVNNDVLKTPHGSPYLFKGQAYRMLALYEESFHGLMPAETYFVFGTVAGGSFDSTRFGPVKVDQLTGRVR